MNTLKSGPITLVEDQNAPMSIYNQIFFFPNKLSQILYLKNSFIGFITKT